MSDGDKVRFRPVKEIHANGSKTLLLDVTPQLPTGVTISAVSGTNQGQTMGAFGPAAMTVGTLTIVATDTTSSVDNRTILANKHMTLRITPGSAERGKCYDIECRCKLSNDDTLIGIVTVRVI